MNDPSAEKGTEERAKIGRRSGVVGIVCNLLLFTAKLTAGIISGSVSVVADALNNLSDASSSVITLLGFRLAGKPADSEHPYGHARYEYLTGLVISFMILTVGFELLKSSAEKILAPEPIEFSLFAAGVLTGSILVKVFLWAWNRRSGIRIGSSALLATAADSRNDAISTAVVLACHLLSLHFSYPLDGWAGAAVSVFILISGFGMVRDTVDPLLGKAPDPEEVESIRREILSFPGVLGTHDLIVHDYGPGRRFASVHVEMAAEADPLASHETIDDIERSFRTHRGLNLVVHYDPIVTTGAVNDVREWLTEEVRTIDPSLSVHDVRAVPGPNRTNLIFDVVRPSSIRLTDREICAAIRKLVADAHPEYFCVITVDDSFASVPHTTEN